MEESREEELRLLTKSTNERRARSWLPARYVLAVLLFFGFANVYALRVNLSMAIVAMVHQPDDPDYVGEFHWDNSIQGIVLGSFFYGYIVTQVPGGWLAGRYGGKMVFGIGVLGTTVLTLVTPIAARTNVWLLVAVRVLEGLGEGVTFPALHAIWARWAPPAERSRLSTLSLAGPHFGTVVSMPLSGYLCRHGFGAKSGIQHYHGDNWPSVFYVFGSAGLVWCLLWFLLAADSPSSHPRIDDSERHYIETALQNEEKSEVKQAVPWRFLLTSGPVWADIVTLTCGNWGFYTLLTCLPTFMKDVLQFNLVENGVYSALPYLTFAILIPLFGVLADYLRARWISTTAVRKIFTVAGNLLPSLFLVLASYTNSHTTALLYLIACVGFISPAISGVAINPLDIAPRYAGVVMGLSNAAATLPGIIAPLVADSLTSLPRDLNDDLKTETLRALWRQVFFVSAEISIFGAFFYVVFASGKLQWWAGGQRSAQSIQEDEEKAG